MCRFSSRFWWLGRACATLLIAGSALGGEVYEWVGPDGVTRYTLRRGEARRFVIPPPEQEPGPHAPRSSTAPASAEPEIVLVPAARVPGTLPTPIPTETPGDPARAPEIEATPALSLIHI